MYEVIVLGLGPAGCEAALQAAGMLAEGKVLLIGFNLDNTCLVSHSGHFLSGQDALRVLQEKYEPDLIDLISDVEGLSIDPEICRLDGSSPPLLDQWMFPRRDLLHLHVNRCLQHHPRISVRQGRVSEITVRDDRVEGVRTRTGRYYPGRRLIFASGSTLEGQLSLNRATDTETEHPGESVLEDLARNLRAHGVDLVPAELRIPPTIDCSQIDFSSFSYEEVEENSHLIALSEKILLVPEGENSSLYTVCCDEDFIGPVPQQEECIKSFRGLENSHLVRPGYRLHYSCISPDALDRTMGISQISGLYAAGLSAGIAGFSGAVVTGALAAESALRGEKQVSNEGLDLLADSLEIAEIFEQLANGSYETLPLFWRFITGR